MADFGVISDVSATLVDALIDALSTLPTSPVAELHNLQGTITTAPPKLAICLYEVNEDATSRNQPMHRSPLPAGLRVAKPPMALTLKYLLTPFANTPEDEQRILGRAMQALYEDAIFSGPDLRGSAAPTGLVGSADILTVTLDPLTLEERSRIFHSIQQPYRLSLSYQVRVANIHPREDRRVELARSRSFDPAIPAGA
ncbi:DUF4255 domain-containing protein [Sphingomonas sp. S1-29]|uniref:DUF4255 domain-containing protein n=1 Tax=Sphingomonas sp. S1-29 TaxID=2991074 RepID=UPI0022401D12|nr:DUF4255 domain-containing protein [Sphingomonas sp. S1-29]UZK70321.1 DUF4255 domain-containing protein [Sphingomonas sp. S1-29]